MAVVAVAVVEAFAAFDRRLALAEAAAVDRAVAGHTELEQDDEPQDVGKSHLEECTVDHPS